MKLEMMSKDNLIKLVMQLEKDGFQISAELEYLNRLALYYQTCFLSQDQIDKARNFIFSEEDR